jgi:hypothetical protein
MRVGRGSLGVLLPASDREVTRPERRVPSTGGPRLRRSGGWRCGKRDGGRRRSSEHLLGGDGVTWSHVNGRVIFYADRRTDPMKKALDETERRRIRQGLYNEEHGIEPATILKDIQNPLVAMSNLDLYSAGPTRLSELAGDVDLPSPSASAVSKKR